MFTHRTRHRIYDSNPNCVYSIWVSFSDTKASFVFDYSCICDICNNRMVFMSDTYYSYENVLLWDCIYCDSQYSRVRCTLNCDKVVGGNKNVSAAEKESSERSEESRQERSLQGAKDCFESMGQVCWETANGSNEANGQNDESSS